METVTVCENETSIENMDGNQQGKYIMDWMRLNRPALFGSEAAEERVRIGEPMYAYRACNAALTEVRRWMRAKEPDTKYKNFTEAEKEAVEAFLKAHSIE